MEAEEPGAGSYDPHNPIAPWHETTPHTVAMSEGHVWFEEAVGGTSAMIYVYHTIRWPAAGADAEAPRLQPWLEDLSQNGTYVNGRLVGKHKTVELQEADRIELVFPQGRVPPSNMGQNGFPIFTFGEPKNPEDKPPEPVAAGDESAEA